MRFYLWFVFQFFNNRKNIIEGDGGGGGGVRGVCARYYGYHNYYRCNASYIAPDYICDESDDRYICPYRYYGIIY